MNKNPGTLADGYVSFEGGIDTGFAPVLIDRNQLAWAFNTTVRGGFPLPRPGIRKRALRYAGDVVDTNFTQGRFQGAGTYTTTDGRAYLAASISGRIFTIDLTSKYLVTDISIPGDLNEDNIPHAWFQQAKNWLVVQNNRQAPFLYNGSGSRRSILSAKEVPVGGPMAFGRGRLWVAHDDLYYGSDLLGTDVDAVIKFTENDFLNEGGAFRVPSEITGLAFAENLDKSTGEGDLNVFTASAVFAFEAPIDRTYWKNLTYPIQRFALLKYGSLNHESIIPINSDMLFRSQDGIRSLKYARSDFEVWGNTPISRQVDRALDYDTLSRLGATSTASFNNRMLMTTQPQPDRGHGVWHRGLVVLDYHLVSGMGKKLSPAWEGVWSGLRILRIITCSVENVDRCFIFALNDADEIELWEVSKRDKFDHDGEDDRRIKWGWESRSFTLDTPAEPKTLLSANQWFDQLTGELDVTAYFRSDGAECWSRWATYADCAEYRQCDSPGLDEDGECVPLKNLRAQKRPRMGFGLPPDVVDTEGGSFSRQGYEFQVRLELEGFARLKRLQIVATNDPSNLHGDLSKTGCLANTDQTCETGCQSVDCCDLDDYGYEI